MEKKKSGPNTAYSVSQLKTFGNIELDETLKNIPQDKNLANYEDFMLGQLPPLSSVKAAIEREPVEVDKGKRINIRAGKVLIKDDNGDSIEIDNADDVRLIIARNVERGRKRLEADETRANFSWDDEEDEE